MEESASQTSLAVKCPTCDIAMDDMGDIPFRTGGTSGTAHLLFGNWAELGEDVLHLDAFLCPEMWKGSAIRGLADERFAWPLGRDSLGIFSGSDVSPQP